MSWAGLHCSWSQLFIYLAALVDAYQGRRVIVRSDDPVELASILAEKNVEKRGHFQVKKKGLAQVARSSRPSPAREYQ
jgi:hypothetical protein